MDREKILARLTLLTGDPRETLLGQLAGDAAGEIERRLKPGVSAADHEGVLVAAAAAEAAYRLALLDAALAPDTLSAGDVRAEYGETVRHAAEFRDACFASAAELFSDRSFVFREVRA